MPIDQASLLAQGLGLGLLYHAGIFLRQFGQEIRVLRMVVSQESLEDGPSDLEDLQGEPNLTRCRAMPGQPVQIRGVAQPPLSRDGLAENEDLAGIECGPPGLDPPRAGMTELRDGAADPLQDVPGL